MTRSTHTPRRPTLSTLQGGTVATLVDADGYDVALTLAGRSWRGWVRAATRAEAVAKAMRRAFGAWSAEAPSGDASAPLARLRPEPKDADRFRQRRRAGP